MKERCTHETCSSSKKKDVNTNIKILLSWKATIDYKLYKLHNLWSILHIINYTIIIIDDMYSIYMLVVYRSGYRNSLDWKKYDLKVIT